MKLNYDEQENLKSAVPLASCISIQVQSRRVCLNEFKKIQATRKLRGGSLLHPSHVVSTLHVENFPSDQGGNWTMDDLAANKAFSADTLTVTLNNGHKVHAAPPPSSGVVVGFMLKVMDGKIWRFV